MTPRANDYTTRQQVVHGWPIRITCYELGGRYHAMAETVDLGARFARAEGGSREEAERNVLEKATERLARTRRM